MPSIRRPNTPARIPPPYFLGGPRSELTFNSQWVSKDINRIHDEIPEDEPGYCGCSICKRGTRKGFVKGRTFIRHMLQLYPGGHPNSQGSMPPLPSSAQLYTGVGDDTSGSRSPSGPTDDVSSQQAFMENDLNQTPTNEDTLMFDVTLPVLGRWVEFFLIHLCLGTSLDSSLSQDHHRMSQQVDSEDLNDEDAIEDLQAGHSSAVATAHYARVQGSPTLLGDYFFLKYVNCSKRYRQLLQFCPPPEHSRELSQEDVRNLIKQENAAVVKEVQSLNTELKRSVVNTIATLLRNPNVLPDFVSNDGSIPQAVPRPAVAGQQVLPGSAVLRSPPPHVTPSAGQPSPSPAIPPGITPVPPSPPLVNTDTLPLSEDSVLQRSLESLLNRTIKNRPISFKSTFQREAARAVASL
ncbi:hypothetical protein C366_05658 [Cryptococcus neoformans Tu401-1]|nr:hypothetical protein C366_05658 [Cryptococcus neoformans var. grubii Tu401-1]